MRLSTRLLRNTVANYLGTFVTFLVTLILTPFVINTLGETRYGVWALVGSASGYLALLDLGLTTALAKFAAEYATRDDDETVDQMASTLFFVFVVVGFVGLLGLLWLSFHFARFFDVPDESARAAQAAIIILGLNFGVGLPLSVYNALTVGYQRYDILNLVTAVAALLNAVLTALVFALQWDLTGLAAVVCAVTITKALALRWSLRRWVRPITIRLSKSRKPLLRTLLSYSVFMLVMVACRTIETNSGPIMVGRLVGLGDVTVYAVGAKVGVFLRLLASPVTVALFPAFSELDALADHGRLRSLLTQGLRVSALVGMPIAGITIVLIRPLIFIWVGPQHLASAGIGALLLLKALVDQQLLAASSLLGGLARLKLYTAMHVVAVLASLGFALVFSPRWGGIAVAAGSLLAWSLVLAVTVPHAAYITGVGLRELLGTALIRPLAATMLLSVALFGLSRWRPPVTLLQLLLCGMVAVSIYLIPVWFWCLDGGEKMAVARAAKQVLSHVGRLPAANDRSQDEAH